MSLKQKLFTSLVRFIKSGLQITGKTGARLLSALSDELAPAIIVKNKYGTLRFFCPGRIPVFRAETFLTKEPETLEWIDSFKENSVFWDIGANVGTYSLYASFKNGAQVLAFEPAAPNFYVLNRNIEINQRGDNILALCIAFNDVTRLDCFNMGSTKVGDALHSFSQAIDCHGQPFSPKFKQGMIGFTIDEFVEKFNPKFPNHIKIDVDGIEDKIIAGGSKTISDPRVESILVELDDNQPDDTRFVISFLEQSGLKLTKKEHADMFDNSKYSSIYNHIFVRT